MLDACDSFASCVCWAPEAVGCVRLWNVCQLVAAVGRSVNGKRLGSKAMLSLVTVILWPSVMQYPRTLLWRAKPIKIPWVDVRSKD